MSGPVPQQTVAVAPPGQPIFVQPGMPPGGVPMTAPPGTVIYYPQLPGAGGAGGILMPTQYSSEPRVYKYVPSDNLILSILTLFACGIFSPLTLALTIPALLFSLKSKKNAKGGAIKIARHQGVIAGYLNVAAIFLALVVACVATGITIGLYADDFALQMCLNKLRARNGGELPTFSSSSSYRSRQFDC